jgi:hypothetical protein
MRARHIILCNVFVLISTILTHSTSAHAQFSRKLSEQHLSSIPSTDFIRANQIPRQLFTVIERLDSATTHTTDFRDNSLVNAFEKFSFAAKGVMAGNGFEYASSSTRGKLVLYADTLFQKQEQRWQWRAFSDGTIYELQSDTSSEKLFINRNGGGWYEKKANRETVRRKWGVQE